MSSKKEMTFVRSRLSIAILGGLLMASPAWAAEECTSSSPNCTAVTASLGNIDLAVGQSIPMDFSKIGAVSRVFPGNRAVVDVFQDPKSGDIYLRGKKVGTSDLLVWGPAGKKFRAMINVGVDTGSLSSQISRLMPDESDIRITSMGDSLVLSGSVADATKLKQIVALAEAFVRGNNEELVTESKVYQAPENEPGKSVNVRTSNENTGARPASLTQSGMGANRIINLLSVRGSQQVMLEVKVAEISKTLLDKMGAELKGTTVKGDWTYGIINSLLSGDGTSVVSAVKNSTKSLKIDAQKKDELIKVLAEPNIVAMSGQEGSFLSGGKVFIPTGRDRDGTITLEEKEYGVGLRFVPTVLANNMIDLRVSPEVSELQKDGSAFTTGGITSIFPSVSTRRASTTVQLRDGESFAIAGLLKNNVTETIKRFPILGEIPFIGALFRSSEFQTDKTELLFVITPRLVKPSASDYALPTDNFKAPGRAQFFLNGKLESSNHDDDKQDNSSSAKTDK